MLYVRIDIKRFQKHNFFVSGKLVIISPGTHEKEREREGERKKARKERKNEKKTLGIPVSQPPSFL